MPAFIDSGGGSDYFDNKWSPYGQTSGPGPGPGGGFMGAFGGGGFLPYGGSDLNTPQTGPLRRLYPNGVPQVSSFFQPTTALGAKPGAGPANSWMPSAAPSNSGPLTDWFGNSAPGSQTTGNPLYDALSGSGQIRGRDFLNELLRQGIFGGAFDPKALLDMLAQQGQLAGLAQQRQAVLGAQLESGGDPALAAYASLAARMGAANQTNQNIANAQAGAYQNWQDYMRQLAAALIQGEGIQGPMQGTGKPTQGGINLGGIGLNFGGGGGTNRPSSGG